MTLQHIVALYSGLAYLAAAGVCIPTLKVLGPHYPSRVTAPWWMVMVGVIVMVSLFFRSVTILFPGELVAVREISWVTPIKATSDLMLQVVILDCVLRWRAPPPLISRLMSIAAENGVTEKGIAAMAFATPATAIADASASEAASNGYVGRRIVRLMMLAAGVAAVVAIVGLIIATSPTAL